MKMMTKERLGIMLADGNLMDIVPIVDQAALAVDLAEKLRGILNSALGQALEADTIEQLPRAFGKTYLSERMKEARALLDTLEQP